MRTELKIAVWGTAGLLGSLAAFAALRAPDFTIQANPSHGKVVLQATAPVQHHFNIEAPMSAEIESTHTRLKPVKSSESSVEFDVPSIAKDSAKVSLFLCDDAKTFCEKHQVSVSWEGQA